MANRVAIAGALLLAACSYESPPPSGDAASPPPVVFFEDDISSTDEGATGTTMSTIAIPVVLSKPAETRVTVKCNAIAGGTATEQIDFVVNTHDVVFEIGEMRKDVSVNVLKDTLENEGESFQLALDMPVGATLDPVKIIHTVNISDTILPRISFSVGATTTTEGTQTSLTLNLDLPSDGESAVVIGVNAAQAASMDIEDIALADGRTVTIPNGEMSATVAIGEVADSLHEATESIGFELKDASLNLVIDAVKKSATHTITDDDPAPTVDFLVANDNADEDDGTKVVTVRLSAESGLPVMVDYNRQTGDTAAGTDATVNGSGSTLTFSPRVVVDGTPVPGETSKTFTITITDDNIDEDAETVIVELSNEVGATLSGNVTYTLTIAVDDTDPPSVVSFNATTSTNQEEDNGSDTTSITINVVPPSGRTITLPYSVGGTAEDAGTTSSGGNDYDIESANPLVIAPNSATGTITVRVFGDNSGENPPDETVVLTLTDPGANGNATLGTSTVHTLTIDDND